MSGKVKFAAAAAAVILIGAVVYSKIVGTDTQDVEIKGLQASFIGEVAPGETLKKSMFEVKGVTESGKLEPISDFSSETTIAAENGASCEVVIEAQGYSATVIVDITREPVSTLAIGYPDEETATLTYYSNGDLEFTGVGEITNFSKNVPWKSWEYTHVYIDDTLEIESMDYWFQGNDALVYCSNLPKTVKTMKYTFAGCTALEETPAYFQCSDLQVMDFAFSGCEDLKTIDVIPVKVSSMKYTFENCSSLQEAADLSKVSNLVVVDGLHCGCGALRTASEIPETVTSMAECYKDCLNIKEAVAFPPNVQDVSYAYSGDSALQTGATIPASVIDFSNCFYGCSALHGDLQINTDASKFSGVLKEANTNGDKLSLSGTCGNLLAIQQETGNQNIVLADPEDAAQQNARMLSEGGN